MKWMLTLLILFSMTASAGVECEVEALPLGKVGRVFVRLVKLGAAEGEISPALILNLSRQKSASIPIEGVRDVENFSLIKGFRRVVPRLTPKMWLPVARELGALYEKLVKENESVQVAKDKTALVYRWRATKHFVNATPIKVFVSSTGEYFVFTPNGDGTDIWHLDGERPVHIENATMSARGPEVFETKEGRVLYAWIAWMENWVLKINDARTGEAIDLSASPTFVPDLRGSHHPKIFEDSEGVKVALVPEVLTTGPFLAEGQRFGIVHLDTKKFTHGILPEGFSNYTVTEAGKVLAYGYNLYGRLNGVTVFIKDLLTDEFILNKEIDDVYRLSLDEQIPQIFSHMGRFQLAFLSPQGKFLRVFDELESSIRVLGGKNRDWFDEIIMGTGNAGQALFATASMETRSAFVYIGEVFGAKDDEPRRITLSGGAKELNGSHFMRTPLGKQLVTWELNEGMLMGAYVVDIQTGSHIDLPLPRDYSGRFHRLSRPFVNPATGQLLVFINVGDSKWQLFEFYGREDK